jgi:hypothetical protein
VVEKFLKKPTLDEMWKRIEQFGIKRDMFELSNPSEEEIRELYEIIREKRNKKRDEDQVHLLQEYIKKLKTRKSSS